MLPPRAAAAQGASRADGLVLEAVPVGWHPPHEHQDSFEKLEATNRGTDCPRWSSPDGEMRHGGDMQTRKSQPDGLAAAQHILSCESCLNLTAFAFEEHDIDALDAWVRRVAEHLKAERERVLQ
jgi:hypothetical protein